MTFLSPIMLFALAAIAVPVLIHIFNRTKAERVQWGAMQFLLASVSTQQRRILLEEMILLALRCVMLALVALAMARPFLPSRAGVPWLLVLPAVIAAAVCAGVGAAMWSYRRGRTIMFACSLGLLLLAASASILERSLQSRWWSAPGGDRDIAILIDASGSMTLTQDDIMNFTKAIEEARNIVEHSRRGDAISLISCGPVPHALISKPTSDRSELLDTLDREQLAPVGGPMGVLEALTAANHSLSLGGNPHKSIILIGDGQGIGWNLDSQMRWEFLAQGLHELPTTPRILFHRLPLPDEISNVALSDIRLSRHLVGIARDVDIDVSIANTGSEPARPETLSLWLDGTNLASQSFHADVLPGATETVRFTHHFREAGLHELTARIEWDDDIAIDQQAIRIIPVLDQLPVLIIDGSPSKRSLQNASAFIEVALNPKLERERSLFERIRHLLAGGDEDDTENASSNKVANLVVPEVVSAADMETIESLDDYRVIILANVPRLPESFTKRLADFARVGGGVLVIPGDLSVAESYNAWKTDAGEPILPARLSKRVYSPDKPIALDPASFSHPSLTLVADTESSDIDKALIKAHWQLEIDPMDADVRVGGLLGTGEPFLTEREIGIGYILLLSTMLDRTDTSLASLKSFVPLVHELVYYLASPMMIEHNLAPGAEFSIEIVANDVTKRGDLEERREADSPDDWIEEDDQSAVITILPSGERRLAEVEQTERGLRIGYSSTHSPGLYEFVLPTNVAPLYSSNLFSRTTIPFSILGDAKESFLDLLSDADIERAQEYVDLFPADKAEEMEAAISDEVPGEELWRYLVIGAVLALLGETAVSRWIAIKRQYHADLHIEFGEGMFDVKAFRGRADQLLSKTEAAVGETRGAVVEEALKG
ncbi:MAG: BatA domain-containing protein [Verrucomicrobia bacterium]|nr:BatA domain-containing protein [Verrucomicrobiota bacterium]